MLSYFVLAYLGILPSAGLSGFFLVTSLMRMIKRTMPIIATDITITVLKIVSDSQNK